MSRQKASRAEPRATPQGAPCPQPSCEAAGRPAWKPHRQPALKLWSPVRQHRQPRRKGGRFSAESLSPSRPGHTEMPIGVAGHSEHVPQGSSRPGDLSESSEKAAQAGLHSHTNTLKLPTRLPRSAPGSAQLSDRLPALSALTRHRACAHAPDRDAVAMATASSRVRRPSRRPLLGRLGRSAGRGSLARSDGSEDGN